MSSIPSQEWEICGVCGARVKRRNLAAHFSRAHPGIKISERKIGAGIQIPYWIKLTGSILILGNFLFFLIWPSLERSGISQGVMLLLSGAGNPGMEMIAGFLLILISGSYMAAIWISQRLGLDNPQIAGLGTLIWMGMLLIPVMLSWWFEFLMVSLFCICLSYWILGLK